MNQLKISVYSWMTLYNPQLQMPNRKITSVKNKPLKLN